MKYVFPILVSIPVLFVWAALFYRLTFGKPLPITFGPALMGVSFLTFIASVAMSLVFPQSKEWRAAAVFNAIPFILLLIAALVLGFIGG
ncbi:MAG: hypothetical protein DMF63_04775 [Acidobacteria bacterium]|nr:MAG: hypothetical protein DMF63_04775 [Acidobacteriota bacterium]